MLTSLRPQISRSSLLAEQGRLTAFPNVTLERSAERRPWTSFRLGRAFSASGVYVRRNSQIAARIAGPVIILCALPGFASAQDAAWTAATNLNWNSPLNWSPTCASRPEPPHSIRPVPLYLGGRFSLHSAPSTSVGTLSFAAGEL